MVSLQNHRDYRTERGLEDAKEKTDGAYAHGLTTRPQIPGVVQATPAVVYTELPTRLLEPLSTLWEPAGFRYQPPHGHRRPSRPGLTPSLELRAAMGI